MKVSRLLLSGIIVIMLVFGVAVVTHAVLVDNHDGTITDTDKNLMWLKDANMAGTMNWNSAMAWADSLEYAGHNDWRLPSSLSPEHPVDPCDGLKCGDSEMGHLFFDELGNIGYPDAGWGLSNSGPFVNLQASYYWSSTEVSYNTSNAWLFNFYTSNQGMRNKDVYNGYVLAVRDAGSAPPVVPEPISSILFVAGGTLLAGRRYLRRKK